MALKLRELTSDERAAIKRLAHSPTAPGARSRMRARIVELAGGGERVPAIATRPELAAKAVRTWLKRVNAGRGFGERADPEFAKKRGASQELFTAPPEGARVICLDEMGPESAKSFPGAEWVRTLAAAGDATPVGRAAQEIDYGRRGKGYDFGAFAPLSGEALTRACHPPHRGQLGRVPRTG